MNQTVTQTQAEQRIRALDADYRQAVDASRSILDKHSRAKGDDAPLSHNDREALDRLDGKMQKIEDERNELVGMHPSLRKPTNAEVLAAALPEVAPRYPFPMGSNDKAQGILGEFVARRHGSDFEGEDASAFNLGKAVRGIATGNWSDADMELRALSIGTDTAGGHAVPTQLAGQVIDRITEQSVALRAGVTITPMDSASIKYPRISDGVTGSWRAENAVVTEDDPALDAITLTARTLAVATKLSYELLEDLTDEGAAAIEKAITDSIATQLDAAVISGSGTAPEIRGLRNQSGITERSNGTNGSVPSWSIMNDAVAQVRQAGLSPNAIIVNPRTSAYLGNLTATDGQPLQRPDYLDGVTILDSRQVPTDITTGSSSNTSIAIAGDFRQAILGVRPSFGVRVVRDSSRYVDSLSVLLVAYLRADLALAQPAGICVTKGLKAS